MKPADDSPQTVLFDNARVILPDAVREAAWVLVCGRNIRQIGTSRRRPSAQRRIDVKNNFLAPGLIDLHVHGVRSRLQSALPRQGTTSFLHSLFSAPEEQLQAALRMSVPGELNSANCLGVHSEGPFLSPEMAGAQPLQTILPPDTAMARRLLAAGSGRLRTMTLCPAQPNAFRLIRLLHRQGVVVAAGHTQASYEQMQQAVECGVRYVTHWCNRMPAIRSRSPGAATAALLDDRVYLEVIADGRHVHPALLKVLLRVKPPEKMILVSDSVAAAVLPNMRKSFGSYYLHDGTLAGSSLSLLQAVKNMVHFNNMRLWQAIAMASAYPAELLQLPQNQGRIAPGAAADLIVFNERFTLQATMIAGSMVYQRK